MLTPILRAYCRIHGVLRVDERGEPAAPLSLRDDVVEQRRLSRALRAEHLDDPAARQPADAERDVERERSGRHDLDVDLRAGVAHPHDRALAELPFDLLKSGTECLGLIHVRNSFRRASHRAGVHERFVAWRPARCDVGIIERDAGDCEHMFAVGGWGPSQMGRTAEPGDRDVRPEPSWRRGEGVDSGNRVRDAGGQRCERAVDVVELGGGEACAVRRGTGDDTPDSHVRRRPGQRRDEPVAKRRRVVDRHRAEEREGQVEVVRGDPPDPAAVELVAEGRQGVPQVGGQVERDEQPVCGAQPEHASSVRPSVVSCLTPVVSSRSRSLCRSTLWTTAGARCADGEARRSATGGGSPRGCRGSDARP